MKKKIFVFIASPGDLSAERTRFREIINELNRGFGDGANVEFQALGWEDTLASTGRRNQSVINEEIDRCDVFILVMYRRWGQEAPDAEPYSSYTEEEFYRALGRWEKEEKPEIFVFFKRVDSASEADPGVQLKKVMNFRKQLEDTRQVLYHYFNDENSFCEEVSRHLRAFAKDELPKTVKERKVLVLPASILHEVDKAKEAALQQAAEAKAAHDAKNEAYLKLAAMELDTAQDAAMLSLEGKIEYARQKFSVLIAQSTDVAVLSLAHEFFQRTGELDTALSILEKMQNLLSVDGDLETKVYVYLNLGAIYQTRGELARAEKFYNQALEFAQNQNSQKNIADCYLSLGNLFYIRGYLDEAAKLNQNAFDIYQGIGDNNGIINSLNKLGSVYRTRGKFGIAAKMYQQALEIANEIKEKDKMATCYVNLGNLHTEKDEIEDAEKMYKKALAIHQSMGGKEGIAICYGNLGNLYTSLGQLGRAERSYRKSLAIEIELGRKSGIASDYANLGNLYLLKGELEKAEEMFLKALPLNEELDRKVGLAAQYGSLGLLYYSRSDMEKAMPMFEKSILLYSELSSNKADYFKDLVERLRKN